MRCVEDFSPTWTDSTASAILFYQRAADLDTSTAAPHSNLAAAYFELGDYGSAISASDAALAILHGRDEQMLLREKVALRKVKSAIYNKNFSSARSALEHCKSCPETKALRQCVLQYERDGDLTNDPKAALTKLILELPRYKQAMYAISFRIIDLCL